jgi:hypothetical protein
VTVAVKIGTAEQVESVGPNRSKVMDPVGLDPPATVALSETAPPAGTEAEAVDVTVGVVSANAVGVARANGTVEPTRAATTTRPVDALTGPKARRPA